MHAAVYARDNAMYEERHGKPEEPDVDDAETACAPTP